jgi:hypothetical protein
MLGNASASGGGGGSSGSSSSTCHCFGVVMLEFGVGSHRNCVWVEI